MNERIKYVVCYRLKKDEPHLIQERLRFTLKDADKLAKELLTLDYIEYLGTRTEPLHI